MREILGMKISDTELACLEDSILDVDEWVRLAVTGKISWCYKQLHRQWLPLLAADSSIPNVPTDHAEFVQIVLAHPQYKNRVGREGLEGPKI